jgi:eukaryotic-like serine/threonine-protein kinase
MKTLDDWPRVKRVLEEALAREGADRQAFVEETCGADRALRAQVENLLAAHDRAGDFLETPAAVLLDERRVGEDQSGRVVSSYRLESRLGAGGMGEVYRARDLRLDRDVALKVLPAVFAADADRVARLKREAQLLASLNHPHIASIYGFEESGGTNALVLELVEGPTLADRIAQGPLPIDEALPIARQIVEAIEAAHEHRVIHRDLKPANIKLRPDGTVKVLDFGLATAFDPARAASGSMPSSPTLTGPAALGVGTILGTAAYMSPEQARGKTADKRCDIWAFGCVLYEMLTGRRPFEGDDVPEILARILEHEPDFDALPVSTAVSIRRLLHRCLEKDARRRLPDIGVARLEIDDALAPRAAPTLRERVGLGWIVSAGLALAVIVAAFLYLRLPPAQPRPLVRASIPLEGRLDFGFQQPSFALSPDGTRLVYRIRGSEPLHIRQLNDTHSVMIAGTEMASNPFFSPDGRALGFFVGGTLKKVSFAGGTVVTLATLPRSVGAQGYRGAAWADEGTIAFAPSTGAGLFAVSDRGGEARPLTVIDPKADEAAHRWPHFLPGGRAVLFTVKSTNLQSFDDAQIVVRSLDTGEQHAVVQGDSARYLPTGHLIYARAGALYAVRFDAKRLAVTGAAVKVADGVVTHPESGAAQFAISRTGTLVYAAGDAKTAHRPLFWVDRSGAARPATDREAPFWWPRISPDGQRIAVVIDAPFSKIWVLDVERGTFTRASQLPGDQDRAAWMPDGIHLSFGADPEGTGAVHLFTDRSDGAGKAKMLFESRESPSPLNWSPDARKLLYRRIGAATGQDVWIYSADDRSSTPFLESAANEWSAAFSPDGRWVAYVSDESGRAEVYVRPFAGSGRHQISIDGGTAPVWSRDGRELFFGKGDTLFATAVSLDGAFTSGAVRRLFSGPYSFEEVTVNYDVAPDGQNFLVPRSRVDSAPRQLELVLNWFEEVSRLAPE